jgi:hypothetical protein
MGTGGCKTAINDDHIKDLDRSKRSSLAKFMLCHVSSSKNVELTCSSRPRRWEVGLLDFFCNHYLD